MSFDSNGVHFVKVHSPVPSIFLFRNVSCSIAEGSNTKESIIVLPLDNTNAKYPVLVDKGATKG